MYGIARGVVNRLYLLYFQEDKIIRTVYVFQSQGKQKQLEASPLGFFCPNLLRDGLDNVYSFSSF